MTFQYLLTFFFFFEQLTVHRFLPFGLMAGFAMTAAIGVMTLPETHKQPTMENLSQNQQDHKLKGEKDSNKNGIVDDAGEKSTLM